MKNLLIILLCVIGILLSGAFIVDEREVVVATSFGSTRVYSVGTYWHFPFSGSLIHVYMNQRDSLTTISITPIDESKGPAKAVQLAVNWQVVDAVKYVSYLNQHSRKELDKSIADFVSEKVSQSASNLSPGSLLVQKLYLSRALWVNSTLGIRINMLRPLGFIPVVNPVPTESASLPAIESAYNFAMGIKADADKAQAVEFGKLEQKNKQFYDYFKKINYYQKNAESKAAVPPLEQLYR